MLVCCVYCVFCRLRPLRRAEHSYRGVLPCVCVCVCVLHTPRQRDGLSTISAAASQKNRRLNWHIFINDTDPFLQRSLLFKRGMDYLLHAIKDMQ